MLGAFFLLYLVSKLSLDTAHGKKGKLQLPGKFSLIPQIYLDIYLLQTSNIQCILALHQLCCNFDLLLCVPQECTLRMIA